jgi:hypothetical protein
VTVPAPPTVTRSVTRPVLAHIASCLPVSDATWSGVSGGAGGDGPALPEPLPLGAGWPGAGSVVNV